LFQNVGQGKGRQDSALAGNIGQEQQLAQGPFGRLRIVGQHLGLGQGIEAVGLGIRGHIQLQALGKDIDGRGELQAAQVGVGKLTIDQGAIFVGKAGVRSQHFPETKSAGRQPHIFVQIGQGHLDLPPPRRISLELQEHDLEIFPGHGPVLAHIQGNGEQLLPDLPAVFSVRIFTQVALKIHFRITDITLGQGLLGQSQIVLAPRQELFRHATPKQQRHQKQRPDPTHCHPHYRRQCGQNRPRTRLRRPA
jgi:hypothetical protein